MDNIIHDLKTERQNVSSGLPAAFKLVPILFYLSAAASLILSGFFYLSIKSHEASQQQMQLRVSQATAEKNEYVARQNTIVDKSKRAEGIAKWLEGSHPLQPVTVAIGRSMGKDTTIAELNLNRNPEIPAHTFLQLKIDGGGSEQVEDTLNSINALNYQTYSAQQVKGRNSTDFQATLIFAGN
ncbi:MAG: hypothetical protein CMO55_07450 [Verrucomicrobiales bacterium]|nr:hypothetical protein [Verrucomicrobiales bacterium]